MSGNTDIIGQGFIQFGTNLTNQIGMLGEQITSYSKGHLITPENENKVVEQNANTKKKSRPKVSSPKTSSPETSSKKTPSKKTPSPESKGETLKQDIENKKTGKPKKKSFLKSTFLNNLRSMLKFKKKPSPSKPSPYPKPSPSQIPIVSQIPSPSPRPSASRRSTTLQGSTEFFNSIKNEINTLFYEIVELILRETISIKRNEKPVKTNLQQKLQFLINYNKFITNLQIFEVKKKNLEATLSELSTIVKKNCEGSIASFGCNATASINGISNIYKFFKDSNYITDDKVNKFIEIAIPIINKFINSESVYEELRQFSDKYETIKNNYKLYNSSIGGRKKKESKKKTTKKNW